MKKRLLARIPILLLIVLTGWPAFAQKRTVSGTVVDAKDGSPLQGVTILPKGGGSGAATGMDGKCHIAIGPEVHIRVISSIGFAPQELSIGDGSALRVALISTAGALNEIVVVPYG